jgi:hypothetical protein
MTLGTAYVTPENDSNDECSKTEGYRGAASQKPIPGMVGFSESILDHLKYDVFGHTLACEVKIP